VECWIGFVVTGCCDCVMMLLWVGGFFVVLFLVVCMVFLCVSGVCFFWYCVVGCILCSL